MLNTTDISLDTYRANSREAFRSLLKVLPFSLAVREVMRMRALADSGVLRTPLLDVGCGDGLFWEVVAKSYLGGAHELLRGLLGIDVDAHELQIASVRLADRGGTLMIADISNGERGHSLDALNAQFATVIANCSLEHVPRLEVALRNIHGFLGAQGTFMMFVPAPRWTDTMRTKQALGRVSRRVAGVAGGVMDGFFQHHHLYPHYVWQHLLGGVGFHDVTMVGLGSRRANALFERYLPPALGSFIYKTLFKRYPAGAGPAPSGPELEAFLEEVASGGFIQQDPAHPEVVEYCIRCRK